MQRPDTPAAPGPPTGLYLISPSSAVADPQTLHRARQRLRALGLRTTLDRSALAVDTRFAGSDARRLAGIQRALAQKHPFVMTTRGGYGVSRLLAAIDWQAVAQSGKRFIGHSDFTAFNLALLAQTGAVSWSGATAVPDFGGEALEHSDLDSLTCQSLLQTVRGEPQRLHFETHGAQAVQVRGMLWGGNLAVLASLTGTPWMPRIKGGILFLEDVSEPPYRIERMLAQLWHAGILSRQKAILLGQFTQYRLAAQDNGYTLDSVVAWLRQTVKVPVITGLPYGHGRTKVTLPVGAKAQLVVQCSQGQSVACLQV